MERALAIANLKTDKRASMSFLEFGFLAIYDIMNDDHERLWTDSPKILRVPHRSLLPVPQPVFTKAFHSYK